MPFIVLFVFVLLLIASALFSAAETAFTAVSVSSMHKLMLGGDKRARLVYTLSTDKEHVLSTLLIGNTIANIAASSVATVLFLRILGPEGIIASTISVTCLILIFSEVLPKTYAVQNPEKISLRTARLMFCCSLVLSPISAMVRFMVNLALKVLRAREDKEMISAADAMRNLILMHDGKGTMLQQDLDMLSSVLDLAQTEISQVMTHRKNLFALNIDEDVHTLIEHILKSRHSRIPVWQNSEESIVGVVHVRDVTDLVREKNSNVTKSDIYSIIKKPWFVPDTTPLTVQLHNFRNKRRHLALVVDEYGTLQGAVTLEDILEEIVGDISDEHDTIPQSMVTEVAPNEYHIDGGAPIRDINRQLRWNLPEDASTIAGLVLYNIERIPEEGEEFNFSGFLFKILAKSGNTLSLLSVSPMSIGSHEKDALDQSQ